MYNVLMVKYQTIVFAFLIVLFLLFSFSPTLLELSLSDNLYDNNREFILEHNYYWPDFNLYLSKIRQAWEGRIFPVEKYTSEPHGGSLIQIFYVFLGWMGRFLGTSPNTAYQLGRIILAPLLLTLIARFAIFYFPTLKSRALAFVIVLLSGSVPKIFSDVQGIIHIENFMQWWSTIDNLQRISFIPHILFGQIGSLFLLYQFFIKTSKHISIIQLIIYTIIGILVGIVFPPSLMTFYGVCIIAIGIQTLKRYRRPLVQWRIVLLFILFTFPSLLYFLIVTKQIPWVALIQAHRLHFMPVPLDQYLLGLGPVTILAVFGSIVGIIRRQRQIYPLIFWILSSWLLASYFSIVRDQSPLRFTQTGVFIPLGLLATYFLSRVYDVVWVSNLGNLSRIFVKFSLTILLILYILENFAMMLVSYNWQKRFITQRAGADRPPVPYPPQTTYPLKSWMDGIRYLRDHTNQSDVVMAGLTAGNFIPAYAGNFVYFGQTNTVDYENKYRNLEEFFRAGLSKEAAQRVLKEGRVTYVFYSLQEREFSKIDDFATVYPFLQKIYSTPLVTIYRVNL